MINATTPRQRPVCQLMIADERAVPERGAAPASRMRGRQVDLLIVVALFGAALRGLGHLL